MPIKAIGAPVVDTPVLDHLVKKHDNIKDMMAGVSRKDWMKAYDNYELLLQDYNEIDANHDENIDRVEWDKSKEDAKDFDAFDVNGDDGISPEAQTRNETNGRLISHCGAGICGREASPTRVQGGGQEQGWEADPQGVGREVWRRSVL
jgi:hypothetical protein